MTTFENDSEDLVKASMEHLFWVRAHLEYQQNRTDQQRQATLVALEKCEQLADSLADQIDDSTGALTILGDSIGVDADFDAADVLDLVARAIARDLKDREVGVVFDVERPIEVSDSVGRLARALLALLWLGLLRTAPGGTIRVVAKLSEGRVVFGIAEVALGGPSARLARPQRLRPAMEPATRSGAAFVAS